MNIEELKIRLEQEQVCKEYYSFFCDDLGDCLVLSKDNRGWIVYYTERGKHSDIRIFANENEACQYFLDEILITPGVRYRTFSPTDFEQSPIWVGNNDIGYKPVYEKELSPKNYRGDFIIKAHFVTNGYNFDGYLIGRDEFYACGLFVGNHLIQINLNVYYRSFTEDNINSLFDLLGCKPFEVFPLYYESKASLRCGDKIIGTLSPGQTKRGSF